MKPYRIFILLLVLLPAFLMAGTGPNPKYWIFFRDKGPVPVQQQLRKATNLVTERSLQRRAKTRSTDNLVDETDLPVHSGYVAAIRDMGFEPVTRSKWLNAITVYATADEIAGVASLPFVKSVEPVMVGIKKPEPIVLGPIEKVNVDSASFTPDYGQTLGQISQLNMVKVHEAGYYGQNVLISILDSGFRTTHPCLSHINVVDTWDFINNNPGVDNETDDNDVYDQIEHGTYVLGTIGGYDPGEHIGTAFEADFLLAKTESIPIEARVEEDYWVAAAEWSDSLGADIITSSLGYLDWYLPLQMDGTQATITRAANAAFDKGIVVLTSAGNEGDNTDWGIITAPADAFNIISVGSVTISGTILNSSSRGPTEDGRIKPEVVALGNQVRTCAATGSGYTHFSGTSSACPLVAGAAALVLSAHPDLTPAQVREALIQTADNSSEPNNTYGYGLVNTVDAVNYWGTKIITPITAGKISSYPNPFYPDINGQVHIQFHLDRDSKITVSVYNILGQKVAQPYNGHMAQGIGLEVTWDGHGNSGNRLPSGLYFCRVQSSYYDKVKKIILLQ